MPSVRSILILLALLISLAALAATHWLTGAPRTTVAVQAMVPDARGGMVPAAETRFDILTRSMEALIDSMRRVDRIRAPEGMMQGLEDPEREAFLRSAIERRGFTLSSEAAQALRTVRERRQAFMDDLRQQPYYNKLLTAAVARIRGALIEIPARPDTALSPADLRREVRLYNPDREALYGALRMQTLAGPGARTYERYAGWLQAVDAYEQAYRRDLLERGVVAAALYRAAAVVSAETDALGRVVFPGIRYGRYWLAGFYPQDPDEIDRIHRQRLLNRSTPDRAGDPSPLLAWNVPIEVTAFHPEVRLDAENAVRAW